ncbi:hypothetical protein C0Q70_12705 [Pomacea canaliculata]|uniref:MACPF domain-containing protein n=1 Tax=Pomacea canaliculata TaxID=400727 RepID=A0A2T7P2C7_POMCA|nr:hypothetical protein C0Q70_12705 [Pomacea canaliculata]
MLTTCSDKRQCQYAIDSSTSSHPVLHPCPLNNADMFLRLRRIKALKLILTFSLALGSQALQQSAQRSHSLAQSEHSSSHVFHNKERTEKLDDDRQKTQLFARVAQDTHADNLFPEGSCRHKKQGGLNADFLLYGYNSLKGCPLVSGRDPGFTFPIFSADYSTSHVTPDGEVLVPRELLLSPDVSCVTSFTSKTVETPYDLTKLLTATATLGDDGGWGPPFSASQDFRQFSEDLRKHVLVVSRATCSLHHVTHLLQKPLPLHPMFVDWVLRLNNTDDEDAYLQFIDTYGTHFVSRARSGASFTLVHKMEEDVYRQHTEGHVTAAASYSSAALLGQYETLTSDHKRAADDFRNQVETMTVAVGAPPPSDGDSLRWLTAADNHPVTISYEVSSLDVLFSKPFMGEGSALERYAIDHVGMRNMVLATKQKYCKYLKTKELVGDCEHLTPGLSLLHTRLMGHSDYTPAASADLCVEKCHQLPDCVAVTVCSGCDTNDIGHNDCRVFRFGNIHSAVTDPQWQTTILVNKLKTLLKVQNTTAVVDPRSESSPALTVTSARDCLTSCVQDASCVGFTLSDTSGRISKCTRLTDLPVSLKQEAGATVYFLSQSSKGFVTRGQTGHFAPSSIPNDWYKASCVIDDECRQENANNLTSALARTKTVCVLPPCTASGRSRDVMARLLLGLGVLLCAGCGTSDQTYDTARAPEEDHQYADLKVCRMLIKAVNGHVPLPVSRPPVLLTAGPVMAGLKLGLTALILLVSFNTLTCKVLSISTQAQISQKALIMGKEQILPMDDPMPLPRLSYNTNQNDPQANLGEHFSDTGIAADQSTGQSDAVSTDTRCKSWGLKFVDTPRAVCAMLTPRQA